jgi:bifunctional ADP-heptose synthase (sugar kinase/adenylyltransferase)
MNNCQKIFLLDDLVEKVADLQKSGLVVVQSHGVFDLIHPGIIKHLVSSKNQGDILVVTVIKDKDIRRGPGRPIFTEEMRLENVASLQMVDYVCLVDDEIPFESVRRIKPDLFAKGQAYRERDQKIHKKIFENEKEFYFEKIKIHETDGFSFSSSQIINNMLNIYPEETKHYLSTFNKKYSFDYITHQLEELKKMKVLLIGDGIIDEYHYCESMNKSAKAHLVVSRYLAHEKFAGGAFAIANHLAGICNDVHLVTLLGREDSREEFILNNLKPNITYRFFYRDDGPSVIKKRYVHQYQNQKLFEIDYLNDDLINEDIEKEIIEYLQSVISNFDLVLVSDFGHGFISRKIIKVLEKTSPKLAVNTQTNSGNAGYNMITKYTDLDLVCLDESELRLAAQEKHRPIEDLVSIIRKRINADTIITTLGRKGSIAINRKGEIARTPIFSLKVVDTVGAGDAFFSFAAPCFAQNMPLDLVSFIGNAVGALAVQIICNKKSVEKHELLEFIHTILK